MENFRKMRIKEDGKEGRTTEQAEASQNSPWIRVGFGLPKLRILVSESLPGCRDRSAVDAILQQPASKFTQGDPRSFFQVQRQEFCAVCYNLDPYKAPADDGVGTDNGPWARREFHIPPGTPTAKIEIRETKTLLKSVTIGCITCGMIAASLSAIWPGWDKEEASIDLCMAAKLPLMGKLYFGATINYPVTEDNDPFRAEGTVLPEGRWKTSEWQFSARLCSVNGLPREAVQFEVYRPPVIHEQPTLRDTILGDIIEHIGTGSSLSTHTGSSGSLDFIKSQVQTCIYRHNCSPDGHARAPALPDRVIWLRSPAEPSGIQLIETEGKIRGPYVALSYCWGPVSSSTFLTNASTLTARRAGIAFSDLPPLFQDVANICRSLGFQYLWIDRLCVIQGSDEDFSQQAPKMDAIYGNAAITVAASSATSENDRILVERDAKWNSHEVRLLLPEIDKGTLHLGVRQRPYPAGEYAPGGDYGRVSRRAWIFQERMLSTRTVFFTQAGLIFECHSHSIWEGFGPGIASPSWSSQLDEISHDSWLGLVEEYMLRDITRPSDRLPAMESVMRRIQKAKGWEPLWGMWRDSLVKSLGWHSNATLEPGGIDLPCKMNPAFYAPSWSWASVDGPISYLKARGLVGLRDADPPVSELEIKNVDARLGVVTVSARAITWELTCEIRRTSSEVGSIHTEGKEGLERDYRVQKASHTGDALRLEADVHLKPWAGVVDGRSITGVIRAPYGEPLPEKSWTGSCMGLMVTRRRSRCSVLCLGPSLRVPGALERIGIISRGYPDVFRDSPRKNVDVA